MNKEGTLFVISGPSGAGKGTVLKEVMKLRDDLFVSVSATTRAPREGEVDGVHYHYVSKPSFEEMIEKNKVLEYAAYCGNYYGTPLEKVEEQLRAGKNVILEIEVVGAAKVKQVKKDAVFVFITPPTMEVLEKRLRERNTETDAVIKERLHKAKDEINQLEIYDYIVINDALPCAANELSQIIDSQSYRVSKRMNKIKEGF